MISKEFEKNNTNVDTSQMEQCSILSNVVNYVQHKRNSAGYFILDVKPLESMNYKRIYKRLEEDDWQVIIFYDTPKKLKGEYLDVYETVRSEILYTAKFNKIQI